MAMSTYEQFLHARYTAEHLLQQSTREGCGKERHGFDDEEIANHFAKLAEGLGYRIEKIEAQPEDPFIVEQVNKILYEPEVEGKCDEAVLAERERCAKIAESWARSCRRVGQNQGADVARDVASVIRLPPKDGGSNAS